MKKIYSSLINYAYLEELAETLNKYKKVFKLDTCARKAHFFAQSREESGADLSGALHGENLDYSAEALPIQFKKFRKRNSNGQAVDKFGNPTTENKKTVPNDLAYEYGRSGRNGYKANQKKIAEIAYGDRGGNLTPEDAWNFRGRGLIQITGREIYTFCKPYTIKYEKADILSNPDWVGEKISLGVSTSMIFFLWKKINEKTNGETDVIKAFNNITSVVFKIDQCKISSSKTSKSDINLYRIDINNFLYKKEKENSENKKYQYDIYNKGSLIKSYEIEKNNYNLLPFPEIGPNWGRFGSRDKGGDNWTEEKVYAALLGFFYSLPQNGFVDKLYFNDISANDGRNIGHKGHRIGNDIDIRYPGSSNGSQTLWEDALKKYGTENKFVEVLENILYTATKWGFNTNYAYKSNIKYTKGVATNVHQDHFHIGLR